MNEQDTEFQPPLELPKPQAEVSAKAEEVATHKEGAASQALELGGSSSAPPSTSVMPADPSASSAQTAGRQRTQDPAQATTDASLIADDVDLIEKEWVDKAKQIVDQTKNDPHVQNKEMNKFKADYLRKRYNKEIKLSES